MGIIYIKISKNIIFLLTQDAYAKIITPMIIPIISLKLSKYAILYVLYKHIKMNLATL